MKTFYFVRHGESESNVTDVYDGPEGALTPKGLEQSKFLAKRFEKVPVDIVIASPYKRTRDTAEIFNRSLGVRIEFSELLVECKHPTEILGTPIGLARGKPAGSEVETLIRENFHIPDWHYSDEENFCDLKRRGTRALDYFISLSHENTVVISHGYFLRLLVGLMIHGNVLTSQEFLRIYLALKTRNTGITLCTYNANQWQILTWNDHAHLGEVS